MPWCSIIFCCLVVNGFSPTKRFNRRQHNPFVAESSEDVSIAARRIALVYKEFEDSRNSKQLNVDLKELKAENILKIWSKNSLTLRDPTILTEDMFLQQTKSLKIRNFLQLLKEEIYQPTREVFNYSVVSVIACFIVWFGFIAENKAISQGLRNTIGIVVLSYPFLISGIGIVAPSFLPNLIQRVIRSLKQGNVSVVPEDDRILYHEAGHFLLAYLLGVPVTGYQLTGNIGISLSTEFSSVNIQEKLTESSDNRIIDQVKKDDAGKLLVVSFAGIITEKLIYGNIRGGVEDYSLALQLVRRSLESSALVKEGVVDIRVVEGYLRWAILQAELLISQNYEVLDTIVSCFRRRDSISAIASAIENAT